MVEDQEHGEDREAVRMHTPVPPVLSEEREQEKKRGGHESPKHENCEQRNFPRQNPPELAEK